MKGLSFFTSLLILVFMSASCEKEETEEASKEPLEKLGITLVSYIDSSQHNFTSNDAGETQPWLNSNRRRLVYNHYKQPLFVLNDIGEEMESFYYEGNTVIWERPLDYHYIRFTLDDQDRATRMELLFKNEDGSLEKLLDDTYDRYFEYDAEGYLSYIYQEDGPCDQFNWSYGNLMRINSYTSRANAGSGEHYIGGMKFEYSNIYAYNNNPNNSTWWFGYFGFMDMNWAFQYGKEGTDLYYESNQQYAIFSTFVQDILKGFRLGPTNFFGKQMKSRPSKIEIRNVDEFFGVTWLLHKEDFYDPNILISEIWHHGLLFESKDFHMNFEDI